MNQYHTVADALKDLVPKRGRSYAEVGRKLGKVSGQLLGQYISGRQKPKLDFYTKWKRAFNEDLFSMIETNVPNITLTVTPPQRKSEVDYQELQKKYEEAKDTIVSLELKISDLKDRLIEALSSPAVQTPPVKKVEVQDEHILKLNPRSPLTRSTKEPGSHGKKGRKS